MMRPIKWRSVGLSSLVLLTGLMISGHVLAEKTATTAAVAPAEFNSILQADGSITISKYGRVVTTLDTATIGTLGVEAAKLKLLVNILQQQKIPQSEWSEKLIQITEHYRALVAASAGIQAEGETLQPLRAAAQKAVSDVDLEKANILFNALRTAESGAPLTAAEADAANAARALTELKTEEAADYYLRASSTIEKLGEKYHEKWSLYADAAGSAFRETGFYTEANALLTTAFTLREKYVPGSPQANSSLNKLAEIKRLMGRYEEALPLYQLALKNSENSYGKQHAQTAIALNNVADIYRLNEKFDTALPLYRRALDINRRILGEDHPDLATTLNNLAGLYEATANFDQALTLYQEALAVNEKAYGKDHPNVATTLNNLAGLYRALGEYEMALPIYERDLAISRKALGNNHPDVATTLNNLGILYFYMEDYARSADHLQQALEIFRAKLGLNHPNTASVEESLVVISKKLEQ